MPEPIWLHKLINGSTLLPIKQETAPHLVTIAASCSMASPSETTVVQKSNLEGVFSRSIPLSICDRFNTSSNATATYLLPVIEDSGFAFFGSRYNDTYVEQLDLADPYTYFLLPHLYATDDQWSMEIRLFESSVATPIKTYTCSFDPKQPEQNIKECIDTIYNDLLESASFQHIDSALSPHSLSSEMFNYYIQGNESCLALSLACNSEAGAKTLYGERNIFDNLLAFTLQDTTSVIPALMLLSALAKNKVYGSSIYADYESKWKKLLGEYEFTQDISKIFEKATVELYT